MIVDSRKARRSAFKHETSMSVEIFNSQAEDGLISAQADVWPQAIHYDTVVTPTRPAAGGATFTLSAGTITAIQAAIASPGTHNANYYTAYKDIYNDILANGGASAATQYWFSQAGEVNSQQFSPTAAGTYIWSYTQGAALTEGANITTQQLQTASNNIATTVFNTFKANNWVFNDTNTNSSEGIQTIVQDDAGSGLKYLQSQFPNANLDYAIWGGTLFARTALGDSSYFSDYNINLTPGSRDCNALEQGNVAATNAVMLSPSSMVQMYWDGLWGAGFPRDEDAILACFPKQGALDGGTEFGQGALGSGTAGFDSKYAALDTALGDMIFNPGNGSQLQGAFSKLEADFSGYYAVQGGDTWNSVAQSYGLTGSQLADLNNTFASGAAQISTSVIVVPSSSSTISAGGSLSVPLATGNDYAFNTSANTYEVVGTAFQDANQGQFSVFNAAGQVTDIASGLTQNVTANVGGTTVNLGSAGDLYSATFGSTVFGSVSTNGGQISLLDPGLSSISGSSGVLGFLNNAGAAASLGENSTGSTATIAGSNLTADFNAASASVVDDAQGLLVADNKGVTGGSLTLGLNGLSVTDDAASLLFKDGSGVTGGSVTLGASSLALTDAGTGLSVLDGSGVTGGNLTLGGNNLGLTDDAAGLKIGDGSGFTGGNITLGASNLALTDTGTGLSVLDGSGVTGGNLTLGGNNLGLTDDATGLTISDGSGFSGGNVTLGSNGIKLTDNAAGLTFSDSSGDSGGVVTLGSLTQGFTDDAAALTVNDASGVSGGAITLGVNSLGLTDDAAGLTIGDGSGISGGNVTLGGNGLKVTDNAAGLTFSDGSGDSGGVVTLGSLTQGFTDDAAGLTVNDASGVSGGAITLGVNSLGLTDDAAGLTIGDGSGISGGNVTLGGNGLKLTDNAAGLTFSDGSGDSGGVVTLGSLTQGFTDDAAGLTVNDASGVSGGAITLGANGLGLTDDAGGLTISDGSGISGGNVTLGGNGLKLTDNAAGLTFSDGSGDSGGVVTLGSLTHGFTDDAAGLTVNDASGVSGGAITLGANNLGLTDDAGGLTIGDGSGITGGNVTLGGNGLNLNYTSSGATINLSASGDGVTASSDTINIEAGGTDSFTGSHDSLTDGYAGTTFINGIGDTFSGLSTDTVALSANTGVTVTSSGGTIDLNGAGDSLNDTSSGATIALFASGDGVTASSDTIYVGAAGQDSFTGNNDGGSLIGSVALNVTGTGDSFTINNGDVVTLGGDTNGTDVLNLANVNTSATGIFNGLDGSSQEQIYNPNNSVATQILDYSTPNDTGTLQDQSWLYDNGTSASDLYNANVSKGVQEADLSYDTPDAIFGTTTALADDYYKATLDLTSVVGGGSQVQLYDNTGSSLPSGTTMEYTDYSGAGGTGTEMDTTSDLTNQTSVTTDFANLASGVNSATGTFSGIDDTGNLDYLTYFNNTDHKTFDESYVYSGTTLKDVDQSVYNTNGQLVGAGYLDIQNNTFYVTDGSYGYTNSDYSGSYSYGFGYGSYAPASPGSGTNIHQIGAHGRLTAGHVGTAPGSHGLPHGQSIAALLAGMTPPTIVQHQNAGADALTNQLVQAMASEPAQPLSEAKVELWHGQESASAMLAGAVG